MARYFTLIFVGLLVGCAASGPRSIEHWDVQACHDAPAPAPTRRAWLKQVRRGMDETNAVLAGDRSRFDAAVDQLWAAHRMKPSSRHVARSLARLLNLPLSEGDSRYARLQHALYRDLVSGAPPTISGDLQVFVDQSFLGASSAAVAHRDGKLLTAWGRLRRVERTIEARLRETDEVDLHAMIGNYAHQTAGMIDLGTRRRVKLAVAHLSEVVDRFDELSPGARGVRADVPGARVVFSYWLAELALIAGDDERSIARYRGVQAAADASDPTPAVRAIAAAARRRAEHLPEGPRLSRLPIWPHGYDSCVACHSRTTSPSRAL